MSKEQRCFITERCIIIIDCIALTSKAISFLDKNCLGRNLAFKIDVSNVFDTLNWDFLIKVLKLLALILSFAIE